MEVMIMAWKVYPIHVTHIAVAFIWAVALIAINAIEFYFDKTIDGMDLFWIVLQNSIIGSANAYWLIRTHITPSEAEIETEKS